MLKPALFKNTLLLLLSLMMALTVWAGDKDFPAKPNPPRLVNDFAGMMDGGQVTQLEAKLTEYARTSSTQITVVTIKNLGGYDVGEYTFELGNRWGIGQKDKDNGVLIVASLEDRKVFIAVGYGLEGVLTDAQTGRIYRNEIVPEFKQQQYYQGLSKASDAVIAATKGEYHAEARDASGDAKHRGLSPAAIIGLIILIYIVLWILKKMGGGGNGGGGYMSGRGYRGFGGGFLTGSILGGGSSGWGGSSGGGGGGFGGFGGGSFGGGGSGGSW